MEEVNQQGDTQEATGQPGNDAAGGASLDAQSTGTTSAPVASTSDHVGDSPNGALPAGAQSASDTSSSALNASQDVGTGAIVLDGGDSAGVPDHKGILETLFADLEGIVHMGKSEIIAVVERAKSLL